MTRTSPSPRKAAPAGKQAKPVLPPRARRQQRDNETRTLLNRMKQREQDRSRANVPKSGSNGIGVRMRKRKAALALTAGVMTLSTGANSWDSQFDADPAMFHIDAAQDANYLRVSETMKEALAEEEGVRLVVYRDVAGYPTVGVGHLVRPEDGLRVGDRITYDRAIDFLEEDLRKAERGVANLVGNMKLKQHQFDALVDLVYNVGEGNVSEEKSPRLNRAIAIRDPYAIAAELAYHHAGGEKARGLVYRSERRANIFLNASYGDPRESGQEFAAHDTGGNSI